MTSLSHTCMTYPHSYTPHFIQLVKVTARALAMAKARYYRRMKRAWQGRGAFDPKRVKPFDESSAKLPRFPQYDDKGREIR